MEETEELFTLQMMDGTYYWDIVRTQVFLSLHTMHGGPFADPPPLPSPSLRTKAKDIVKWFVNQRTRHYLVARAPKYLFITGQRIRQGPRLIDNISDHLYALVSEDAIAIEIMNKAAISYRDMVCGWKTRIPPVAIRTTHREEELQQIVATVSAVVLKYFGVSIDIHSLVLEPMVTFRENRSHYLQLFARHRPKAIVCINNGTLKGLFSAAKEIKVPTLELQHGASSSRTILWSYPQSVLSSHAGLALPTAYLTFSDFWKDNTHYPVRWACSIGNDYFYQEPIAGDDDGVLIVSSYMYHESLISLTLELAALVEGKTIYYKLHPHQFDQKAAVVDACSGKSNIVVVSDEMEFPELFKRCNYVVGVHSTSLYIALQASKKVCLYKRSNYFWHDDVFAYVELFDSASELRDILDDPPGKYFNNLGRSPVFFQPCDAQRFLQALDDVESYV
jgi:hypothetical protein